MWPFGKRPVGRPGEAAPHRLDQPRRGAQLAPAAQAPAPYPSSAPSVGSARPYPDPGVLPQNIAPGDVFEQDGRRYRALSRPDFNDEFLMVHVEEPGGGRNVIALYPYRRYQIE